MKSLWNERARLDLIRRMGRLTPATAPLWGRMNVSEMLAHVAEGMSMAYGEIPTKPRRGPFRRWPLKYLFVYLLPMPRGVRAPREIVTRGRDAVAFESCLQRLRFLIDEFPTHDRRGTWAVHPILGSLSGSAWGALGWRHADHHLRQFGC